MKTACFLMQVMKKYCNTVRTEGDGATWQTMSSFEFGNLVNDPSPRYVHFHNGVNCRYIKIKSDASIEDSIGLF